MQYAKTPEKAIGPCAKPQTVHKLFQKMISQSIQSKFPEKGYKVSSNIKRIQNCVIDYPWSTFEVFYLGVPLKRPIDPPAMCSESLRGQWIFINIPMQYTKYPEMDIKKQERFTFSIQSN